MLAESPATGEFARATIVREFDFPRDHGEHRQFATEWWYFTGNLATDSERHFGFELTFFRYALAPAEIERESRWASTQAWVAHFALTDTAENRMFLDERYGRGAPGIATASSEKLDIRLKDWSARSTSSQSTLQLVAQSREVGLQLELIQNSPIALHGERGLDRKGQAPGNASYYYSIPRFDVSGGVRLPDGSILTVRGVAWLDREWATSSLDPGVEGWDWFGLQLDDGRSLMLYRLRNTDGTQTEFSSGTLVRSDGTTLPLAADAVTYSILRHWRSEETGITYPVEWLVEIPEQAISLTVTPRIDAQEINLGLRYWEGAVVVRGSSAGVPIGGVGYLELAGYQ